MADKLDRDEVKTIAVDLAFAAKTVMQQLANRARTPEAFEALTLLEDGLTKAIPNGTEPADSPSPSDELVRH